MLPPSLFPTASAPRRSCRARHSHPFVPLPDRLLTQNERPPSTASKKHKGENSREEFDDDPFPKQNNKNGNSPRSDSSSSSSSPSSTKSEKFQEAIGWGALRVRSAELMAATSNSGKENNFPVAVTEDSLVTECADLRSLEAKVRSMTSELRSLETMYPTQSDLVEVVADAVDEVAAALVSRHATHMSKLKRDRSVEYTRAATTHLLDDLKQTCAERDDAVKRIAGVRAWRDQLAVAMARQQVPMDIGLSEQRNRLESEEQEKESTLQLLRNLFDQNGQLISQIARAGPVEQQLYRALDDYQHVADEREVMSTEVVSLWRETEETRRKLVREEQRAIDEARVLRAKQVMGTRHLDDLNKILSDLGSERDKLALELEELRTKTKYVTAEYYRREGEAFDGWTPRPSFVDGVETREDWVKKNEKMILEQQRKARLQSTAGGSAGTTTATNNSKGSVNNNLAKPATNLSLQTRRLSPVGASQSQESVNAQQQQATAASSSPSTTAPSLALRLLSAVNNSFESPIFSSVGVDTRGESTSSLFELMTRKITTTSRDLRKVADERSKIERLTSAIHLPVRTMLEKVREGFEANVDTSEYLMRFMGASTVPSFLREPRPVTNEKWNFATTEEYCLDYLIELSAMAKQIKRETLQQQQQQQQQREHQQQSSSNFNASNNFFTNNNTSSSSFQQQQNSATTTTTSMAGLDSHQIKLQYETCVLRALANCAALANPTSVPQNNNMFDQPLQASISASFPGSASVAVGGGGGSIQFPAARRHAYHILHHGNLFKEFSPILRAALMTFGMALPLEFIDSPFSMLRNSMDKYMSEILMSAPSLIVSVGAACYNNENNIKAASPTTTTTTASTTGKKSTPLANSINTSKSVLKRGNTSSAIVDNNSKSDDATTTTTTSSAAATAASTLHPLLSSLLLTTFTTEFLSSSTSSGSNNTSVVGGFGAIELLQLQHALQLDTSIATFINTTLIRKKKQLDAEKRQGYTTATATTNNRRKSASKNNNNNKGGSTNKTSSKKNGVAQERSAKNSSNNNNNKNQTNNSRKTTTFRRQSIASSASSNAKHKDRNDDHSHYSSSSNDELEDEEHDDDEGENLDHEYYSGNDQENDDYNRPNNNNNNKYTLHQQQNEKQSHEHDDDEDLLAQTFSAVDAVIPTFFDFHAAVGVRPLKPTDAPGLVLRVVVEFFLRRHDVFTRTVEQSIAAVAQPLGDTAQIVVTDADLHRVLSTCKVESWKCHAAMDGSGIHPSFVRAMDSLFVGNNIWNNRHKNAANNTTSSNMNASGVNLNNTNNNLNSTVSAAHMSNVGISTLLASSASPLAALLLSCGGTGASQSAFAGPPSKRYLRFKQNFVSDLINREFCAVPASPQKIASMLMTSNDQQDQPSSSSFSGFVESLTSAVANSNNNNISSPQRNNVSFESSGLNFAVPSSIVPRIYDFNDVITYLWVRNGAFMD